MVSKKDIKEVDDIIAQWKDEKQSISNTVQKIILKGPKNKPVKTESDLLEALRRMKVTPGEAYRKVGALTTGRGEGSIRFNWKMIRLTLFIWERVEEDKNGYLKPKIDTVKKVCADKKYKELYLGYFADIPFDYDNEVKLLNKMIAEKMTRPFFSSGFYKYYMSNKVIPQKHLNDILLTKI